jgi:hypothetical protein
VKVFAVLPLFLAVLARKFGRITLVFVLTLAFGAAAKADSVSIQTQFSGNFGFGFLPGAFGLLLFPGPYQLTFQTNPSFQPNSFVDGTLDVSQMNYDPGGMIDIMGPNGFQLSGTFTEFMTDTVVTTVAIPGFSAGETVSFGGSGTFTGLLTDGERWQGDIGIDINLAFNEGPMFLDMSGPVPEPGILLLLTIGLAGLLLRQRMAPKA